MGFTGQGTSIAQADDVYFNSLAQGNALSFNNTTKKWNNLDRSHIVSVRDYGAKGDGITDDTDAINAAIQGAKGKTIVFPSDTTYLIDPAKNTTTVPARTKAGILLNHPGTRLLFDTGAVLQAKPMSTGSYVMIQVTAKDCSIEGGTLVGDVDSHIGATGEWGFGIDLAPGADNTTVQGTYVTKCWGDGLYVRGANDVRILDVSAIDNRRQGLSLVSSARPQVIGGSYSYTGFTQSTAPAAGIDIEPNPSAGDSVTEALIVGVEMSHNKKAGLVAVAVTGGTVSGTISSCNMNKNGTHGYFSTGTAGTHLINLLGCTADENTQSGFCLAATGSTVPATLSGCTARANTQHGVVSTTAVHLVGMTVTLNQLHGINLDTGSNGSSISGGVTTANNQSGSAGGTNVMLNAPNLTVTGHVSSAGSLTAAPTIGINVSSSATNCRVIGSDAVGTYSIAGYYPNAADAFALPIPGVAKQAAIASPTADVTSLKTAVDDVRNALRKLGITA